MLTVAHLLDVTREIMDKARFCFFITVTGTSQASARLMQPFPPEDDLTVWIGTSPETRKIPEIQANSCVTLAYQLGGTAYVTLRGVAHIVDDTETRIAHWNDGWDMFFSGGASGSNYVMLKFQPAHIEVMSFDHNVHPDPYGLKPAVLRRDDTGWTLEA